MNLNSPRLIDQIKLQHGRYRGRAICEITSSDDGLLYLHQICSEPPAWLPHLTCDAIEKLLGRPAISKALQNLLGRS